MGLPKASHSESSQCKRRKYQVPVADREGGVTPHRARILRCHVFGGVKRSA